MAQSMGIGPIGSPNIIIKRPFRFTIQFELNGVTIPQHYIKSAARPQLEIDETEINFLNGWMPIPGRGKWQPMNIVYYDVATLDQQPLYDWIAQVYDYSSQDGGITTLNQSEKSGWAAKGIINMYDGCGNTLETWTLWDCWPQSINFGPLDFESSELSTIDLTIKYRYAQIKGSNCVPTPKPNCQGCQQ